MTLRRLNAWGRRHPQTLLLVIAVMFLAGTGVHFVRYPALRLAEVVARAPVPSPVPEPTRATGSAPPASDVRVGPPPGADPGSYAHQRRVALRAAASDAPDRRAAAVVSFDAFLHPAHVETLLEGHDVDVLAGRYRLAAEVAVQGRVPLPRGVTASLAVVLVAEADQARRQADELERLAEDAGDPEFAEQFRQDAAALRAAADQVTPGGCACVYAVEVAGRLSALAMLATAEGVRLVDAAPAGMPADRIRFEALLPPD